MFVYKTKNFIFTMNKISFYIDKCRCCLKQTDESSAYELDETVVSQISSVTSVEVS